MLLPGVPRDDAKERACQKVRAVKPAPSKRNKGRYKSVCGLSVKNLFE